MLFSSVVHDPAAEKPAFQLLCDWQHSLCLGMGPDVTPAFARPEAMHVHRTPMEFGSVRQVCGSAGEWLTTTRMRGRRVVDAFVLVPIVEDVGPDGVRFDPAQVYSSLYLSWERGACTSLALGEELRVHLEAASEAAGEEPMVPGRVAPGVWGNQLAETRSEDVAVHEDEEASPSACFDGPYLRFRLPFATLMAHLGVSEEQSGSRVTIGMLLPPAMSKPFEGCDSRALQLEFITVPVEQVDCPLRMWSTSFVETIVLPARADREGVVRVQLDGVVWMAAAVDTLDVLDVRIEQRDTKTVLPSSMVSVVALGTHTLVHVLPSVTWFCFLGGQHGLRLGGRTYDLVIQTSCAGVTVNITQFATNVLTAFSHVFGKRYSSGPSSDPAAFLREYVDKHPDAEDTSGPARMLLQAISEAEYRIKLRGLDR
jgi:hypothetical protein